MEELLAALVVVAPIIQKAVERLRASRFGENLSGTLTVLLAMALGVAAALGADLDAIAVESDFWAEVLTGLGIGGFAGWVNDLTRNRA